MKKNEFQYNASLKTYYDRVLNKSIIVKLPVTFAGKVCHGFCHQTTGACFWRRKQTPENGQCVINLSHEIETMDGRTTPAMCLVAGICVFCGCSIFLSKHNVLTQCTVNIKTVAQLYIVFCLRGGLKIVSHQFFDRNFIKY